MEACGGGAESRGYGGSVVDGLYTAGGAVGAGKRIGIDGGSADDEPGVDDWRSPGIGGGGIDHRDAEFRVASDAVDHSVRDGRLLCAARAGAWGGRGRGDY